MLEGCSGATALKQVTSFIQSEVQPAVECEVVSVSRMGNFSEQMQGHSRLRVEFAIEGQATRC